MNVRLNPAPEGTHLLMGHRRAQHVAGELLSALGILKSGRLLATQISASRPE